MSESPVLFDFESMAQAAKAINNEDTVIEIPNEPNSPNEASSPNESSSPNEPIKLDKTAIAAALDRIASDPSHLGKALEASTNEMTPELMEEARRLAMGGQGEEIMREMQRRGIDPNAMRAQMMAQQRALRGLGSKTANTRRAVFITGNRQLKMKNIPLGAIEVAAGAMLNSDKAVELSCSRLAVGPLSGKSVKVWCDPERKGKNKRLTKILGFPIAGEGLIIVQDGDLEEKDFLEAEKEIS